MPEIIAPMDIEKRSMEIISETLGSRVLDPENEAVIKRVIHSTADFDFADTLTFSEHAVSIGIHALQNGCDIVTDTQMARAGINKKSLENRRFTLGDKKFHKRRTSNTAKTSKERRHEDRRNI